MFSKLNTCVLQGLNGNLVEVETDLSRGLPAFNIVGLPDAAIKESKERVRAAIKNSGYEFPLNRITINLAPANLRKEGSQIDLSIAIGLLAANGVVEYEKFDEIILLGELSLDGQLNKIDGALAMVISMRELGIKKCIVPYANRAECGVIPDVEVIAVKNLKEAVDYLNAEIEIDLYIRVKDEKKEEEKSYPYDFSDIKGQETLKRAMEIAAAGSHNLLIIGPPGSGKTMASRRIPSILPKLSFEESIEVTKIYSVAGLLDSNDLMEDRPFRAPHHTSSEAALIGGGRIPRPGEVSLAHNGVLFLDELAEFNKKTLETLRQPIEDAFVSISRVNASLSYPSDFMMIASMNPCPCGYHGDPLHSCSCSQGEINRYLGKISFPLLDRIDLHLEVQAVNYKDLSDQRRGESSADIKERVEKARDIQKNRFKDRDIYTNSQMSNQDLEDYCKLDKSCQNIMNQAFDKYKFSARSHNKILKVARTIADLNGKKNIGQMDLLEAVRYRSLNNKYWG